MFLCSSGFIGLTFIFLHILLILLNTSFSSGSGGNGPATAPLQAKLSKLIAKSGKHSLVYFKPCIFEWIYLAREESILYGINVYQAELFNRAGDATAAGDRLNGDNAYLRILFRPGYAVQGRELTQLQTILQKQSSRLGDHIFKDGSAVLGGELTLDTQVAYLKLSSDDKILIPFIMLFTMSGYLSDKFAKTSVMRFSAFSAVLITLAITYCYYNGLYKTAFGFTLLLATQSAIYSPAKMGYIKECLSKAGLSRGNAYHSSVVLIAILLGTVFFSYLFEAYLGTFDVSTPEEILMKIAPVGWVLVGLSSIEFLATLGTRFYPTKLRDAKLSIGKLISFQYLSENIKVMRANEIVWYSILGTAIFWGMSQNLVAVIPAHAKVNFGVESPLVVNAMLASSVVGIMIGAFLSGRKSLNLIRINNIYTGSIMITVCAILVPVISSLSFIPNSTALILVTSIILLFGVGAGMMIVPLNALMQANSPEDGLGSMLAGKNWLQNIAMISLLIFTVFLANLSFGSEFILYFNAFIAVVGFSIILKKLKTIL